MHILLHGGTVVSAEGTAVLDVLIEDGRIAAVGEHLPAGDAQVVDCAGKLQIGRASCRERVFRAV